jgi:hypothetical protein
LKAGLYARLFYFSMAGAIARQKNSASLKLQPPLLTNLKKEKGFFFF